MIVATVILILAVTPVFADKFTLVIDAGHGGHDAGARGSFSNEKDINLRAALAFGKYVEKNCPDVRVIYTRKTDVFIPLHRRAEIANKNKADVFISIHTNALPQGRIARGLETYTMGMRRSNEKLSAAQRENAVITYESDYKQRYEGYDPNSPESAIMFEFIHDKNMAKSVELASLVQRNVCSIANRPNKGVKQDVFLVLRETSMPACLIELGFITTPDEERMLNDETSMDNIARGIYNAFAKYKNDNYSGITVPFEAAQPENKVSLPRIVPEPSSDKTDGDEKQADNIKRVNAPRKSGMNAERGKTQGKGEQKGSEQRGSEQKKNNAAVNKKVAADAPVFKVQILANSTQLAQNSKMLKGQTDADHYQEGGMYKYTVGASTDYNAVNRLRAQLQEKFPGCFVVAFKNGKKMNVNEAIREFKGRRR